MPVLVLARASPNGREPDPGLHESPRKIMRSNAVRRYETMGSDEKAAAKAAAKKAKEAEKARLAEEQRIAEEAEAARLEAARLERERAAAEEAERRRGCMRAASLPPRCAPRVPVLAGFKLAGLPAC